MAIGSAVARGSAVHVYDESGMQSALIPLSPGDSLQGYTSSSVAVRRGGFVHVYDEKGNQTSVVPA